MLLFATLLRFGPLLLGALLLLEALLFAAARADHVARTIRPALARGAWVVCDRFADSTLAYQCFGQGVPRSVWDALAEVALGSLRPDLTVVLDLSVETGLARAVARGETNRYEALDPEFHARVRAGFRSIAAAEPARCVVVDATDSPEGVAAAVAAAVQSRLSLPPAA